MADLIIFCLFDVKVFWCFWLGWPSTSTVTTSCVTWENRESTSTGSPTVRQIQIRLAEPFPVNLLFNSLGRTSVFQGECLSLCLVPTTSERSWSGVVTQSQRGLYQPLPLLSSPSAPSGLELTTTTGTVTSDSWQEQLAAPSLRASKAHSLSLVFNSCFSHWGVTAFRSVLRSTSCKEKDIRGFRNFKHQSVATCRAAWDGESRDK